MGSYTRFGEDWQELPLMSASFVNPIKLRYGPETIELESFGSYGVAETRGMTLDMYKGDPHSVRVHCHASKDAVKRYSPQAEFDESEDPGDLTIWSQIIPYANVASMATNFAR